MTDDARGIRPAPEFFNVRSGPDTFQLGGRFVVNGFGQEQSNKNDANSSQCGLEPEDNSPTLICHDDSADERSKCWSDKCA